MYNIFNIQLNRLREWLIPTFLRTKVMAAFAGAAYTPLVALHNSFINYRKAKFYDMAMNFQTCYLESYLNDRFDYTQRRIYIDDAKTVEQVYLYQDEESKPLYLYTDDENNPAYLYQDGESLGDILYDFVIFIPANISFDEQRVRAMISTKTCGKKYKIETF